MDRNIRGKGKIPGPHQKAAERKSHNADKHSPRQEIGNQIKGTPYGPSRVKGKEAFQEIDDIYQEVIEKPIKHERVKQRNQRTSLKHSLLAEDRPDGIEEALGQVIEAIFGPSAPDRLVNAVETSPRKIERAKGQN